LNERCGPAGGGRLNCLINLDSCDQSNQMNRVLDGAQRVDPLLAERHPADERVAQAAVRSIRTITLLKVDSSVVGRKEMWVIIRY
jgi:hypothetical protein